MIDEGSLNGQTRCNSRMSSTLSSNAMPIIPSAGQAYHPGGRLAGGKLNEVPMPPAIELISYKLKRRRCPNGRYDKSSLCQSPVRFDFLNRLALSTSTAMQFSYQYAQRTCCLQVASFIIMLPSCSSPSKAAGFMLAWTRLVNHASGTPACLPAVTQHAMISMLQVVSQLGHACEMEPRQGSWRDCHYSS